MMRHKKTPVSRSLFAALLSFTALVSPAHANVPIIDTTGLAELKTQVQTTLNQLNELTEMKKLAEEQLSVIGEFGSLGNLFGGSSFSNIGSESDFYTNMENFAFDPCAINLCQVGDNPVGTTDIEEARDWAMSNFFAGDSLDEFQQRDLTEVRRRAVVYSATNGVALATITHNDLAGAGEQSDALEQIVEGSESLRGDVRANSAIALAAYKVELQQLAMLTAMLGVQSSESIYRTSLYHELGGSEFPDAYIESDYALQDRGSRIKVTVPEQGSGSGSGFGGALIQAVSGGDSAVNDILSSVTGGASDLGSVDGLLNAMGAGDIPTLDADALSLGTLLVDAAEIASVALGDDAPAELSSAITQIRSGLAADNTSGTARALLGVAQTYASTGDKGGLSSALNTASMAISKGDKQGAINFAKGVARDIAKNSSAISSGDYLLRQIAVVEAGGGDIETLVLDSAAIFAAYGSSPDADVAQMLSTDLASVDDSFFKDLMVGALEHVASESGQSGVSDVADALRNLSEEDVEMLRQSLKSSSTTTQAAASDEIFQ